MSDLVSLLDGMSAEQLDRFFHETDAETVVALAQGTDDPDLARLLADDAVRAAVVGSVLARLDEYAVPERLAAVEGWVAFRLGLPRRGDELHHVHLAGGAVTAVPLPAGGQADVTIGCGAVEFVRMVTGGVNAALLHLADRLSIDGDELLALAVGGVFRVPGTDDVAVDPTTLDPVDVADAIAGVKDAHLRAVMAGGLREVVLGEVFRRLPDFVDVAKAERHRLVIGFRIGGRPGGEVDRYVVTLDGGRAVVDRVEAEEGRGGRDATLVLDGPQFLRLVTGHLNPVTGVMKGQVKVRGNVKAALTFSGLMQIPSASSRAEA